MRYVQIDERSVAVGISDLSGPVDAPNMIPLDDEQDVMGMRWTGREWVEGPSAPKPEPAPLVLGRLQFIVLCQTAGGMTDAMLVEAQKNPAFEAFWIKYQMASAVERDDPITRTALDALAAGDYLPNGKAAVLAAWPSG